MPKKTKKQSPEKTAKDKPAEISAEEVTMRYSFFKEQLQQHARELQELQMVKGEFLTAKDTLTQLKDVPEGKELLVPLGGNSYLNTTVSNVKTVLSGIGADVVVDKPIPDTLAKLESQVEELTTREKELLENMRALQNELEEIEPQVRMVQQAFQQRQLQEMAKQQKK